MAKVCVLEFWKCNQLTVMHNQALSKLFEPLFAWAAVRYQARS